MLSASLLTAQFATPALYYKLCPFHQPLIPAGFYKPCVHLHAPHASISNSVKECDVSLFHSLSLLHKLFLSYYRRSSSLLQSGLLFDVYDITPKYLSNLECGAKIPKLETFISIANALKCDANSLLCDVLDATIPMTSSSISDKLTELPVNEQRRFLRIIEFMVDDA